MKNRIRLLGTALLVLAGQSSVSEELEVTDAQIRNLGIEFALPEPAPGRSSIEATASVIVPPGNDAFVSTPEAGLLTSLTATIGTSVSRGDVVATVRSPGFLALQREFLDALNGSLLADSALARDQQLFDEGIIAGRRLQETATEARIAAAALNEHRQLLEFAGLRETDIRAMESSQVLLPTLEIRAPFDGVVIERLAAAGQRLDPMSPIFRIADLSTLWLDIAVPLEKSAGVRPGMRVRVHGSPIEYPAGVISVGRSVNPESQAITVHAELVEKGHALEPGQFVSVSIESSLARSAPTWKIPAAAVTRSGDGFFIFVRVPAGIAVRGADFVGSDGTSVFVSADINARTEIAITGITAIKALWSAVGEAGD